MINLPCLVCNKSIPTKPEPNTFKKYSCSSHFEIISYNNQIITFFAHIKNFHILHHYSTNSINLTHNNNISLLHLPTFNLQELPQLKDYLHSLIKFNAFM